MNIIYIKFHCREDQVKGYYELATQSKILSFPNEIYGVPLFGLQLLDKLHISYRRATDDEVAISHGQIRNPAPVVLQ